MGDIDDIDAYEAFFRELVVAKRVPPNVAARALFESYPDERPITLCFAMTITASTLEEWRSSPDQRDWNDWERTSYWLGISGSPISRVFQYSNINNAILETYRAISLINCDLFLLESRGERKVMSRDLGEYWRSQSDEYFSFEESADG